MTQSLTVQRHSGVLMFAANPVTPTRMPFPRYPRLAPLRVPKAPLLSLRWSPQKAPYEWDYPNLVNPLNPLRAKLEDQFHSAPDDALRWRVITETSAKFLPKATVRQYLKRRWRAAFLQALNSRGLNYHGRPLQVTQGSQSLRGTLEIIIHKGNGFANPFGDLIEQAKATLDVVSSRCKAAAHQPPI